jgi:hypothetical protein
MTSVSQPLGHVTWAIGVAIPAVNRHFEPIVDCTPSLTVTYHSYEVSGEVPVHLIEQLDPDETSAIDASSCQGLNG